MSLFKKFFVTIAIMFVGVGLCYAENHNVSSDFSITVPEFTIIKPMTSPVLTANITNRTGNMHTPLHSTFRVITNASEAKTLYLKANVVTDGGYDEAMFEEGGQVYITFANLSKIPTQYALNNCKNGGNANESPGIVAYPVTSVIGAQNKYIPGKHKYEVTINKGNTDITVNIGSNVLKRSFAGNDPRGFYQAILSLTETDI